MSTQQKEKKKIPNTSEKFALSYNEVNVSKSMRSVRYVPNRTNRRAHTYSVIDNIITIAYPCGQWFYTATAFQ